MKYCYHKLWIWINVNKWCTKCIYLQILFQYKDRYKLINSYECKLMRKEKVSMIIKHF